MRPFYSVLFCGYVLLFGFSQLFGQVTLQQKTDPAGLFDTNTVTHYLNDIIYTTVASPTLQNYSFTHWTINGERNETADGVAVHRVAVSMIDHMVAIAHYLPSNQDDDNDGVPDWYEIRFYNSLSQVATSDGDSDGFSMSMEFYLGTSPINPDVIIEGGASIRRSSMVFANLGGAKKLEVSSSPAGLLTSSTTYPEINTTYTTPNLDGANNGYHFGYWEVNDVRQADASGLALSRLTMTMDEDKKVIAHYFPSSEDTDVDGVSDWYEWRQFGSLSNSATSDSDGDGFNLGDEKYLGLSSVIKDEIIQGGASIRRSSLVFANLGGAKKLEVSSNPAGLLTSSTTYPETDTIYTSPSLDGANNGYHFGYWEVNDVRQADPSGLALSRLTLTMNEDKDVVARYFPSSEDTDGDGIADWYEWKYFGSLNNSSSSDGDADSYSLQEEKYLGLSPLIKDDIQEGSASIRRSKTFPYIEFLPGEDADGDGLNKEEELALGTSDDNPDSDGDGFNDREETERGSDPTDPDSVPNYSPPVEVVLDDTNFSAGEVAAYVGSFLPTSSSGNTPDYTVSFIDGYGSDHNDLFEIIDKRLQTKYALGVGKYLIRTRVSDAQGRTTIQFYLLSANQGLDYNVGLVAWYPFDDGDAKDMSGNGNDGTLYGPTLATDRVGNANKAFSFDGSNDYIQLPQDDLLDGCINATISVWFRFHPNFVRGQLLSAGDVRDGLDPISMRLARGATEDFGFCNTQTTETLKNDGILSIPQMDSPTWQLMTIVLKQQSQNSSSVSTYLNNVKMGETVSQTLFRISYDRPMMAQIGNMDSTSQYFKGSIDDVRIYNRALTEDEVVKLYRAESPNHFVESAANLEMIWVEPGTFTMGQSDISNASPEHNVTLTNGFYLGKYEVTQAQYQAVMTGNTDGLNATPSNWPNNPNRPVEKVSHDDIQKFLTRLNTQQAGNIPEGWAYVLPTEAQWEYACRAGTTTAYSWGDSITSSDANYAYDGWGTGLQQTADVGQYSANPWGFFDMHGNVWEWTADAYASYATGAQTDPFNVGTALSARVLRGGAWYYTGTYLRSASRHYRPPSNFTTHMGFRVGFQQVILSQPNTPPHGLRAVPALSVVENQPAGYVVGQILATDPDGDAITYSLVSGTGDTNNNDFLLEANGTLKTTRSLQYPKGSNLSIRVQATDSNNASIEKVFRVTRPPGRPRLSGNFVIPDTFGVGDVVCEITAEDADGDIISFFLVDGEGAENNAQFVLDPTGRLRTATAMDYDATGNWSVRIQIRDENNATFEINLASVRERIYDHSIEENTSDSSETHAQDDYSDSNQSQAPEPHNSPPRDLNTSTVLQIAENAPIGTWIADFTAIDPDGESLVYRLLPGYEGSDSFRLEANGTLLSTKEFDFESDPTSYLIGVEAKDGNEAVVTAEFTVTILDVWENRPPSDLNTSTVLQIAENAPIGKWIADFTAIDPEGESLVYRLLPGYEGSDSFSLEANGTLLSTKEFDFESDPISYHIGVEAKDENEAVVRAEFTVSILDVLEDSNHSATTTEDLLDANTSMYEDSNEESASYSSETHAQDHYSDFNQSQAPESDNSPPRDLNSSTVLQIAENVPIGSWIGDFTAIDPDGESLVYRMLPGYEGYNSFRLDTNGTLLSTKEFDYESDPASYLIGVEAKDENEAVVTAEFTVSILDVLEDSNKSTTIQTKLFIDVNTAFYEESVGSESNGSATISVTDELSKWEETLVLGPFYKSDSGWVFSMNFGWVYFDERDFDDSWFWVEQLGWVWTLESTFPFLFLNQYNHWFYFFEEDEDKWLYNYLLEEWMSL
ncbi:SUMF1/EgtB/PvdO family nonheme iron enzyme [Opitutales bacterium]|nr:SUMF1/EgtB/PvdO family nonheme iron enzyme [Opitutales bacterium]